MKQIAFTALLSLGSAFCSPAKAFILIQDTFEAGQANSVGDPNYMNGCTRSGNWRVDSYPRSSGGDGPEVRGTINGVTPHGGSCYAYHHYATIENSAVLHMDETQLAAHRSAILHGIYYVYWEGPHPPIHLKGNKFYFAKGAAMSIPNVAHYSNSNNDPNNPNPDATSAWKMDIEASGTLEAPGYLCPGEGPRLSGPQRGHWYKVEFYMDARTSCAPGTCCSSTTGDIWRIWVDNQILVSSDHSALSNSDLIGGFWAKGFLMGNASNCQGLPDGTQRCLDPDITAYLDDVCISTTASECGGMAAIEFSGGGDITPPATPRNVRVI